MYTNEVDRSGAINQDSTMQLITEIMTLLDEVSSEKKHRNFDSDLNLNNAIANRLASLDPSFVSPLLTVWSNIPPPSSPASTEICVSRVRRAKKRARSERGTIEPTQVFHAGPVASPAPQ